MATVKKAAATPRYPLPAPPRLRAAGPVLAAVLLLPWTVAIAADPPAGTAAAAVKPNIVISEGGHRVPLVARWPGVVAPDRSCEQLVCLSDLMATCAEMLDVNLPDSAAEDSISFLPLLRGQDRATRQDLVHQCYSELLAIRQGPWKLALCAGDGTDRPWCNEEGVPHDLGELEAHRRGLPPVQLYNVVDDPGETRNLQAEHPEIVERLRRLLAKYVSEGRSTPGLPQKNDVEVPIAAEETP
ncbi:MAG: hypothetical protein ACYC6Y_26340 [Thermoguttaceae bacterium]